MQPCLAQQFPKGKAAARHVSDCLVKVRVQPAGQTGVAAFPQAKASGGQLVPGADLEDGKCSFPSTAAQGKTAPFEPVLQAPSMTSVPALLLITSLLGSVSGDEGHRYK